MQRGPRRGADGAARVMLPRSIEPGALWRATVGAWVCASRTTPARHGPDRRAAAAGRNCVLAPPSRDVQKVDRRVLSRPPAVEAVERTGASGQTIEPDPTGDAFTPK